MSGYKVVPVEPTQEMIEAFKAMWSLGFCDDRMAQECYAAIMDAAPAVQGEPVEYQCHSCRKTTPPPAPFKAYVECGECGALTAAPIAARLTAPPPAEQQPVRLPQRAKPQKDDSASIHGFCDGWNNCLDEVARLNGDRMASPEADVAEDEL